MDEFEFDRDDLSVTFDRTFPADPAEINPVVEAVMLVVSQSGCAHGQDFEVETALREAIANAIKHGCHGDATKTVRCIVACDQARGMLLVVRDSGHGFDPDTVPSPLVGENVFRSHGRGIYLINQLMDEVSYKRGGTEIHMRKLPKPAESPSE